jgi:hypothetical protein
MGGRGMAGVKIDFDNTKNEIEKVKTVVSKKTNPQTVTVTAPVAGSEVTNTRTVSTSLSK